MDGSKFLGKDTGGIALDPLPRWVRRLMTLGPLVAFAFILAVTLLVKGHAAMTFLLGMTIGGFVGGGKLVILAGAVEGAPIGMWPLVGMVVFGDTATALLIMANMHHIYRIPALGRRLAAAREAGFQVLNFHRWMRRAAEFGLVVFIAAPFQGTGAVLGVVLGRILGLSRLAIFLSIFVGSSLGAMFVALAGRLGEDELTKISDNPILGVVSIVITLVITFFLGRWFLGQGTENQNHEEDHHNRRDL